MPHGLTYYYAIARFSSCRAERKYAHDHVWFLERFAKVLSIRFLNVCEFVHETLCF